MLAQLRYHFKNINVEDLSLQQQIELFAQLKWARQQEAKLNPFAATTT